MIESDSKDESSSNWKETRLEELRRWRELPLKAKLDAIDELLAFGEKMIEQRKERGLSYIDPTSGEPASRVAGDQASYERKSLP